MWKFLNSVIALIFQITSSGWFLFHPFFFLALHLWQQPLCFDSETVFVIPEQVSPSPWMSLAWLLLLFLCCPQPWSRGGLEGLQARACLREAMFRHPAASQQQPRLQALWPCSAPQARLSYQSECPQRSSQKSLCPWATEQPAECSFLHLFSFFSYSAVAP